MYSSCRNRSCDLLMAMPAPRRPVSRAESVLARLRNGCTIIETAAGTGVWASQVASAIRDDPLYAAAYATGRAARLNREAVRDAIKEVYG